MTTENHSLPACLTRDNLTSPYWPNLSFGGLASIVALGLVFLLTSFNRLNHTDLWGHLNYGRWIAEHHRLPAVDPLAAEAAGPMAFQGAWLSQLIGYEVQQAFGNEGLVCGHALLMTLIGAILVLAGRRRGVPMLWAWTAAIAMFVLDLPIAGTIRPQLFGQLGAALCLFACSELPRRRHPLFWLPVVAALWANLHGSVLMGLAIVGLFGAACTWNALRSSRSMSAILYDRRTRRAWLAVGLMLAGVCINPAGPKLLGQIAGFGQHAALASISEWRPLAPASLTGVLMIVSIGLTLAIARRGERKWQTHELLLLAVFGLATLPAIRMLAWWAVVWPWVVLPHALRMRRKVPAFEGDRPTAMRSVLAIGFLFMALLVAPPTFSIVTGRARGEGLITVTDTPIYVADELVRRHLAGRIAAPMDWADFLVWKTDGRLKPLVHSHVHLLAAETWRDYEAVFRGDAAWLDLLRTHQMQYVLVPRNRFPQLARQVVMNDRTGQGGVRLVYQDQRSILAEVLPPR